MKSHVTLTWSRTSILSLTPVIFLLLLQVANVSQRWTFLMHTCRSVWQRSPERVWPSTPTKVFTSIHTYYLESCQPLQSFRRSWIPPCRGATLSAFSTTFWWQDQSNRNIFRTWRRCSRGYETKVLKSRRATVLSSRSWWNFWVTRLTMKGCTLKQRRWRPLPRCHNQATSDNLAHSSGWP